MFTKQDIKSTLRVDQNELLAFIQERPTVRVSYSEYSEKLLVDVLGDLETEDFQVEATQ